MLRALALAGALCSAAASAPASLFFHDFVGGLVRLEQKPRGNASPAHNSPHPTPPHPARPPLTQGPFVPSTAADYAGQNVAVEAVDGAHGDFGLVLKDPAHRYAVTAPFPRAVSNGEGEDLVIQYGASAAPKATGPPRSGAKEPAPSSDSATQSCASRTGSTAGAGTSSCTRPRRASTRLP